VVGICYRVRAHSGRDGLVGLLKPRAVGKWLDVAHSIKRIFIFGIFSTSPCAAVTSGIRKIEKIGIIGFSQFR
jgi:hypothetical protein